MDVAFDSVPTTASQVPDDTEGWPERVPGGRTAATVFIVDDDEGWSSDVRRLLVEVGYRVEGMTLTEVAAGPPPGVLGCVILDLDSAGLKGHEVPGLLRSWRWALPVVLVSGQSTIPAVIQALRAGVADVLPKPIDAPGLLGVVEEVVVRYRLARAAAEVLAVHRARFDGLSKRERQVALGIARGQLNKQVAHDLGLTLATIKFHRARAMAKLGVRCVPELVLLLKSLDVLPVPTGPVTTR